MKFYRYLSIAREDAGNSALLSALQKGAPGKDAYLLALTNAKGRVVEILSGGKMSWRLKKDHSGTVVIGAAASKDSAELLACELLKDCYKKTGGFDLRAYLKERFGEVPE